MIETECNCPILNVFPAATDVEHAVSFLYSNLEELRGKYIIHAGISQVIRGYDDKSFNDILNGAAMLLPGSKQLVLEMHTGGYPEAKRIDGVDYARRVFTLGTQRKEKHFFVGASLEHLETLRTALEGEYKTLNVAGILGISKGSFENIEENGEELKKLADEINNSGADIIWFGLPSPFEEKLIFYLSPLLNGVSVAIGYSLEILSGSEKDAPMFMKNTCTDWLYRVWQNPGKHFGKTLVENIRYIWLTGKKTIANTLSWVPAMIAVMIIFVLSSQTGMASKETSEHIAKNIIGYAGKGTPDELQLEAMNVIVRMIAHMMEYAGLSLCIGFAVTINGFRKKMRMFYMCMFGLCVAICDEIFQVFIPGRYGDLIDVCFDGFGIIATAVLLYILGRNVKDRWTVPSSKEPVRRRFLNVCIDDISFEDAVNCIERLATGNRGSYVVTPNVDHIIKVEKDIEFRRIYENASLILTDGSPLMWIADSLGYPIKEKVTGADMLPSVCERAAEKGLTMFFLGGREGVGEKAKEVLCKKYEGLKVVGVYAPPLGFENDDTEVKKTIDLVNRTSPDILVIALGAPKQEKFAYHYRKSMDFGVALNFGAALDFQAGSVKRAPKWVRQIGMEWFYRFLKEPIRLFKRYFIDDMRIFYIAWKYRNEIIRIGHEESLEKNGNKR